MLRSTTTVRSSPRCSPIGAMLQTWTVPAGSSQAEFPHPRGIQSFAWNPKLNMIATGCLDGLVRLWQAETGELIGELEGHAPQTDAILVNGGVRHVAFSADGRLATAGGDASVRLWEIKQRRLLQTMTGHQAEVERVAFDPGGTMLASCSVDETAKLGRPPTASSLTRWPDTTRGWTPFRSVRTVLES